VAEASRQVRDEEERAETLRRQIERHRLHAKEKCVWLFSSSFLQFLYFFLLVFFLG
jgi:hypothetical protein